jgi:hypothetical protein
VLLGKERRRTEHCRLPAIGDGDERRAQRNLGLAEADIAAHQAIHRLSLRHVVAHRFDRGCLVGRFLEAEAIGERLEIMLLD